MEKINVDLIPNENDLKVIHASQNDTESRKFGFKLFSQEGYYEVPEITNIDLKYDTEAGGIETLLPVNTSTPTTTPLNAVINGDEVYFNERVSDGNKQNIEKIKGNTLVWNQQVSQVYTKSYTSTGGSQRQVIFRFSNAIKGHKYLLLWTQSTTLTSANRNTPNYTYSNGTTQQIYMSSAQNNNLKAGQYGWIFTAPTDNINNWFDIYYWVHTPSANVDMSNFMLIDLTMMYGSGNEPTSVSDFTDLFPLPYYDYNTGSLLSFNGTGLKTENASQTENNTLSLPVSTYFPTGMKSAGRVYDELTESKAINRIGVVDLGTLTWNYVGDGTSHARFVGNVLSDVSAPSGGSSIANAICSKYEIVTEGQVFNNQKVGICITTTGRPMVYDPAFTDATTFKTAMNGVYLYYELATPTEEKFTKGHLICSNGAEIDLYKEDDMLVCECEESLTGESGIFDCKIKIESNNQLLYSALFKLHCEVKP